MTATCTICWELIKTHDETFTCTQCTQRVCGSGVVQMAPVCSSHMCIHLKCPTCRWRDRVTVSTIMHFFIGTNHGSMIVGKRKLVRMSVKVDDDITIISVKRSRIG